MYNYFIGQVVETSNEKLVLEVGGIGYEFLISNTSLASLKIGDKAKIYAKLIVKEDEMTLCGFCDESERVVFDELITVSGVGKKLAMAMLSSMFYADIVTHIVKKDSQMLVKLKGVGKKTADRICVELSDKFKKKYGEELAVTQSNTESPIDCSDEIILALSGLGFSNKEIKEMLAGMPKDYSVEEAIKYALKNRKSR